MKRICELCEEVDISHNHYNRKFCDDCRERTLCFNEACDERYSATTEIMQQTIIMMEANEKIIKIIETIENPNRYIIRLEVEAEKTMQILKKMSQSAIYKTRKTKR